MLDRFQRLARWISPLRPALWLLALVALAALVYLLLEGEAAVQDRWLLPLSTLLGWGLGLEALVLCFTDIPPRPDAGLGLVWRWWWRLKRTLAKALALFLLTLLLTLLWLTLRGLWMTLH